MTPTPTELQIVAYHGSQGIYLLYMDQGGNEMTDTYHETVEDAMRQAEFEFQVAADDWALIGDTERG